MKVLLAGGVAAMLMAGAAGPAQAQEAFGALLAALPMIQASGHTVTMEGRDEIITDLHLTPADGAAAGSVTIGRLVLSDVGARADGALLPEIGAIALDGILIDSGTLEDGQVAIGRIEAAGADFAGLLAIALGEAAPDPAILGRFDRLVIEGVEGEIISDATAFRLGRLSVLDAAEMRIGAAELADLHLEGEDPSGPVDISIARVAAADIDVATVIAYIDAPALIEMSDPQDDLLAALAGAPVSSLSAEGIGVEAGGGRFTLDAFAIEDIRVEDGIATAATLRLDRMAIPVELLEEPEIIDVFTQAGMEEVVLDFAISHALDLGSGKMVIDPLHLAIDGLGGFDLGLALSGLPTASLAAFDTLTEDQILAIALDRLRLTIEDRGMVAIALAAAEREMGQPPEMLIQQMTIGLRLGIASLGKVPALTDMPDVVEAFVRHSGRLTLELMPATPVSLAMAAFGDMADPVALIDSLAPRLTHEAAPE